MQTDILAYLLYPEMEDFQPISFVKKIKKEAWQDGVFDFDLFYYNYIFPWVEEKNGTKLSHFFEPPLMDEIFKADLLLKPYLKWWD